MADSGFASAKHGIIVSKVVKDKSLCIVDVNQQTFKRVLLSEQALRPMVVGEQIIVPYSTGTIEFYNFSGDLIHSDRHHDLAGCPLAFSGAHDGEPAIAFLIPERNELDGSVSSRLLLARVGNKKVTIVGAAREQGVGILVCTVGQFFFLSTNGCKKIVWGSLEDGDLGSNSENRGRSIRSYDVATVCNSIAGYGTTGSTYMGGCIASYESVCCKNE
jgi:hypothetical protein